MTGMMKLVPDRLGVKDESDGTGFLFLELQVFAQDLKAENEGIVVFGMISASLQGDLEWDNLFYIATQAMGNGMKD